MALKVAGATQARLASPGLYLEFGVASGRCPTATLPHGLDHQPVGPNRCRLCALCLYMMMCLCRKAVLLMVCSTKCCALCL